MFSIINRIIVSTLLLMFISSSEAFSSNNVMDSRSSSSKRFMTYRSQLNMNPSNNIVNDDESFKFTKGTLSRRNIMIQLPFAMVSLVNTVPTIANAISENQKMTSAEDGNLPNLPPEASRSYLQYRIPLQVAIDYYIFELRAKLSNIDDWGEVNQLFQTNNNRGQGQPNKIERDYTNTMRILGLSMPPDEMESMRDAQFKFERAMQKITKATAGVRRDLPIEIDSSVVTKAEEGWEEGRVALNEFLVVLNEATGLNEMKLIPESGPEQVKKYGRSPRRYFELMKKTKLCQNRGGPALSQAWGQLMISGYLQENMDSCGIPDPIEYFYQ